MALPNDALVVAMKHMKLRVGDCRLRCRMKPCRWPETLPNVAVAVGTESCELQFLRSEPSRMTFSQLQVMLHDDALALTQCRFQIAPWQCKQICRTALWLLPVVLQTRTPAVARNATECRVCNDQCFCRMLFWWLPMTLPNSSLAVVAHDPG